MAMGSLFSWEPPYEGHDPRAYVYHYTKAQTARQFILHDGKLRFGPFATLNDPFEAQTWTLSPAGLEGAALEVRHAWFEVEAELLTLKRRVKVLCVTMDDPGPPELPGFVGLFMALGYAHPRLWAQYADDHRGVCLVFDRAKLAGRIQSQLGTKGLLLEGPVKYGKFYDFAFITNAGEIEGHNAAAFAEQFVESRASHIFFNKYMDWRDEVEYRWLLIGKQDGPEFLRLGDELVCVICGAGMDSSVRQGIADVCSDLGIAVRDMAWINGRPAIRSEYSASCGTWLSTSP
jgi:cytochrome c-type biogenesis protein CcmH/NrfF